MKRLGVLLAAVTVVLAACGGGSAVTTVTTTTVVDMTTTGATTTLAAATTAATATTVATTTTAATTTLGITTTTAATTTTLPSGIPSFSGCTPPGTTLPNGTWAVFIEGVSTVAGVTHTTLDLACWFDGVQADVAAAHDGRSTPVEFHPYIRNQNPLVFDVIVAPGAIVRLFGGDMSFAGWVASLPPDNGCSAATGYSACILKVTIVGGQAVEFSEPLPEWSGDGRGS